MRHETQFALTIAVLALAQISPGPLSAQNEHAAPIIKPNDGETGSVEEPNLKPRTTFRDCEGCPIMVVVAPGTFEMGSPADEKGHRPSEAPQTGITFKKPLAIGQFEITVYQFGEFSPRHGLHHAQDLLGTARKPRHPKTACETRRVSWENPGFDQSEPNRSSASPGTMPRPISNGCPSRPDLPIGCSAKPNGSMPPGPARREPITQVTASKISAASQT